MATTKPPVTSKQTKFKARRKTPAARPTKGPTGVITLFLDQGGRVAAMGPVRSVPFTSDPQIAAERLFHGIRVRFPNNKPLVDQVRVKLGEFRIAK